jgi:CBS domain-containing protein
MLTFYSPLSAILRREPVAVPLDATIREGLEAMDRAGVGSVVIVDRERRIPVGIFTHQDLLRRVSFEGVDLQRPIASVMTSGLIALSPQATAHQAVLTMARNGVGHVVVVGADGALVGVVSQNDLFTLQRMGVKETSREIRDAQTVDDLRRAAASIRRLADGLLAQGVACETLTQSISTLNDLLTVRVIELTADRLELPPVPICWVAFGSEGRLEQTFSSDQDNGIIFDAEPGEVEGVRQALLPVARTVNETLDACGFALCKGNVMAGSPRCCLHLDEWRRAFLGWILEPSPEALLAAVTFFDFRPVYGAERLAEGLRETVLPAARDHSLFLRYLAEDALRTRPPLGTLRDFAYDGGKEFPRTVDLKLGSRPFVDGGRVLSLARGLPHTNTIQRLRSAGETVEEGDDTFAAMVDGFSFVHLLRLRNQCRPRTESAPPNRIDPATLNELERNLLKEAFRQARKLQHRLRLDFGL